MDTQINQVYLSDDQLREELGNGVRKEAIQKVLSAVRATSGQILTYNGEGHRRHFLFDMLMALHGKFRGLLVQLLSLSAKCIKPMGQKFT